MTDERASQAVARELGAAAESDVGLALLRYVSKWETDHNPHWIDLAILVVTEAGLLIPPCLQQLAAHIATRRLMGLEQAAGGHSVVMEEVKGFAFACMALLIARSQKECGKDSVGDAAKHAANAIAAIYGPLYKASTLEKDYGRKRLSTYKHWERICSEIVEDKPDMTIQLWAELSKIPSIDPGNRRE